MLMITKSYSSDRANPTGLIDDAAVEDTRCSMASDGRSVTRRIFLAGSLAALGSSQMIVPGESEVFDYRRQSIRRQESGVVANLGLTVTQAIFSGRANPTGEIVDPVDVERVLTEVARNRDAITTSIRQRIPGHAMLMVKNGATDSTHGLPGEFYVDDGHALDGDASRRLSSYILDSVELKVPTAYTGMASTRMISYSTADIAGRDDSGPYPRSDTVGQGRGTVQYGKYRPAWWNEYIKGNNCYAYACNVRTHGQSQRAWPHPGYCATQKIPTSDAEFRSGLDSDGVIKISDKMEPVHGTADDPAWIVGLCSGVPYNANGRWDYHFYRKVWSEEDQQYYWAGKPNAYPVEFIRDVGQAVEEDAKKRGYKWQGYGIIHDITICAESVT